MPGQHYPLADIFITDKKGRHTNDDQLQGFGPLYWCLDVASGMPLFKKQGNKDKSNRI